MSKAKKHSDTDIFKFSAEDKKKIELILTKYPKGREKSALLPLLDLAQRACGGWLPKPAIETVAATLNIAPIRAYEVASFYSMFNLQPVGEHFIQVCRTTPCWLRGSDTLTQTCKKKLGIDIGETTKDKKFTLKEVECLGGCSNAPVVQINDDYYEDLDEGSFSKLIDALQEGKSVKSGPQINRIKAAPITGLTTLLETKTPKKNTDTKKKKN